MTPLLEVRDLRTQNLTTELYQGGLASSLELIYAQVATLTARIDSVQIKAELLKSSVGLIRALGGGWNRQQLPTDDQIQPFGTFQYTNLDKPAPAGSIDIGAKTLDIVEARETRSSIFESKAKQSGLSIAITSPIITAVQTAQQMSQAAGDTKDSRMQVLAAASSALSAKNAIDAIKAGQGSTINGQANQIATSTNPDGTVAVTHRGREVE